MPDEKYTFETARVRLEEIAVEVRKKDTSLEKSLDLLEEGVRLANICTELVDHTDVSASVTVEVDDADAAAAAGEVGESAEGAAGDGDAASAEDASEPADTPGEPAEDGGEGFDEAEDEIGEPADTDAGD